MIQSLSKYFKQEKNPKISLTVWEAFCVPKILWAEKLLQDQNKFFFVNIII